MDRFAEAAGIGSISLSYVIAPAFVIITVIAVIFCLIDLLKKLKLWEIEFQAFYGGVVISIAVVIAVMTLTYHLTRILHRAI